MAQKKNDKVGAVGKAIAGKTTSKAGAPANNKTGNTKTGNNKSGKR